MTGEGGDGRPARVGDTAGTKPAEAEQHPCPRCDSTNTKFCYYNNYNLSQPRYFCKSCRRYWTQGGTLRNIPVGGGTRRSSVYKRLRTTTTATTTTSQVQDCIPVTMVSDMGRGSGNGLDSGSYSGCEVNLNEALPKTGSFSSLLTTRVGNNGFMNWPGYGFGLGVLDWPMEALGEGNGGGAAGGGGGNGNGNFSVYNTWQMSAGGGFEGGGGLAGGDGGFAWPDLSISTPATGLNFKLEKPHLY